MTTEEQKARNAKYMREWRAKNPEKAREISKRCRNSGNQSAWRKANRDKVRKYEQTYAERHPDKAEAKRVRHKLARYGITPEQYDALLQNQNGVCAICGLLRGTKKLAVDHDHSTKKVRGLLCQFCNTALGKFLDSIEILKRAISYLEKS